MAFTREQIEEIRSKLELYGSIKDVDFPEVLTLTSKEEVVLIQEGKNIKTKIINMLNIITKFKGYFTSETALFKLTPIEGDYAYVGTTIGNSFVYIASNEESNTSWINTNIKALDYIEVLVTGAVSVGENGNWHNKGVDTGIPARGSKGDPFTYTDFTEEQLDNIKKPANDAALIANEAANKALQATTSATTAARAAIDGARVATETASNLQNIGTSIINNTNVAIDRSNNAATQAIAQAELAKEAALKAFTEAEIANTAADRAEATANSADDVAQHPSYVGTDWYVYVYNRHTKTYSKTAIYVKGEPFSISKVFKSIVEMQANFDKVKEGAMVIINNPENITDPDNSKVFTRDAVNFIFLYQLSKLVGEAGKTPIIVEGTVAKGEIAAANLEPNGVDEKGNPIYRFNAILPKGDRGAEGATPVGITDIGVDPNTGARKFTLNFSDGKNYQFYSPKGDSGSNGTNGTNGANPIGISDLGIDPDTEEHKYTLNFNNSTHFEFRTSKGDKGLTGAQGPQGVQGSIGPMGNTGTPGYSPVRGVDYWTTTDVQTITTQLEDYINEALGTTNQTVLNLINRI